MTTLRNADIAAVLKEIALFLSMEDAARPRAYEKRRSRSRSPTRIARPFASGGAKLATTPASARASPRRSASCSRPAR
jgi:hypothetical protein